MLKTIDRLIFQCSIITLFGMLFSEVSTVYADYSVRQKLDLRDYRFVATRENADLEPYPSQSFIADLVCQNVGFQYATDFVTQPLNVAYKEGQLPESAKQDTLIMTEQKIARSLQPESLDKLSLKEIQLLETEFRYLKNPRSLSFHSAKPYTFHYQQRVKIRGCFRDCHDRNLFNLVDVESTYIKLLERTTSNSEALPRIEISPAAAPVSIFSEVTCVGKYTEVLRSFLQDEKRMAKAIYQYVGGGGRFSFCSGLGTVSSRQARP